MKLLKKVLQREQKGFTLLEILLVVAAIAILAGIVILAINPNKQLGDTRNSQRRLDINTILNAVYQYSLDHNGALPGADLGQGSGSIPTGTSKADAAEICLIDSTDTTGATNLSCADQGSGYVYLSDLTTNGVYLGAIPMDPAPAQSNSGVADDGSSFASTSHCFDGTTAQTSLGTETISGPDSNDYLSVADGRVGSGYYIYQDSGTGRITVFAPCTEQTLWNETDTSGAISISSTR